MYLFDVSGATNLTPAQKAKIQANTPQPQVVITKETPADLVKKLFESSSARQALINAAKDAEIILEVNKDTAEVAKQIIKSDEQARKDSGTQTTSDKIIEAATTAKGMITGAKEKIQAGAVKVEEFIIENLIPVIIGIAGLIALVVFLLFTKQGRKIVEQVAGK